MSRFLPLSALFLLFSLVTPHAMAADPVKVRMQTNYGNITLELYPDKAPQTVANFLRYVDTGFYEKTIFHRVIADFMIQGGGFDLDYRQKPTLEPIVNEAANGLKNNRGTLAMARTSDPHSATSQFFINLKDNAFLDFTAQNPNGWGYCVFGKVVEGMNVVDEIAKVPTGPGGPFPTDAPKALVVIDRVVRVQEPVKAAKEMKKEAPAKAEPAVTPKETPVKPEPDTKTTTKESP
jgi:peptidyl-prolyl cis-trans isomerase B (cyclophilin B)